MKIVFLSDDFPPQSFGGAGIVTYEFADGMKRLGHQVFVITTCRKKSEAGKFDYQGIKVFRIASDYSSRWRSYISLHNPPVVRAVRTLLQEIRPDVVHANNIHFYLSYRCLKIAKQYSKVVILTAHDVMAFNFGKLNTDRYLKNFDCHTTWFDHFIQAKKRWNPLRNLLIKKYFRYADKIFTVSEALKVAFEQNGIKNAEVMRFGADSKLWNVDEAGVMQFKQKHDLENKKVILFGGRLSEAKGGLKALEAMVHIVRESPNAVLLVVSKIDGHTNHMQEVADGLGIGNRLVFSGWMERNEIKYAFACADIVLVPSICFDSFPRIVLEAMASGKPVVGTCYGGAQEIIVDGVTGYVINPLEIKKMAEKILDILMDPIRGSRFGKAGLERVKNDFDLDDKIALMVRRYNDLLGSRA